MPTGSERFAFLGRLRANRLYTSNDTYQFKCGVKAYKKGKGLASGC